MSDTPKDTAKAPETPAPEPVARVRKEIPLISVPNDRDMIAEEMAEMFDEDQEEAWKRNSGGEGGAQHEQENEMERRWTGDGEEMVRSIEKR